MALEDEVRAQTQSIDRLVNQLGSRSAPLPSSGAAGGGEMPNLKQADGVFAGLIQGFERLRTGSNLTADAVNMFGGAISKIPGIGGTLGAAFGSMTGTVQDTMAVQKASLNAGAGFNQNLTQTAEIIGRSGLTNQQFMDQQVKMGQSMAGLGSNTTEATKNLTAFQDEFRKSKTGEQLRDLGFTAEEQNRFANTMLANNTARDLTDKKSRAEAVAAAEKLTQSTIQQSQATNQSIDSVLRKTALDDKNIEINSQLLAGGEEQQRAYSNLLPHLQSLGPTIQSLAEEALSDEGVTSEKSAQTLATLGPAGEQLIQAVQLQKEAAKEGATQAQKDRAEQAMISAKNAVDARTRDPQMLQMARMSGRGQDMGDDGAALRITQERGAYMRTQMQQQNVLATANKPSDVSTANRFAGEQTNRVMAGVDENGKRGTGADVIAAANQANMKGQSEAAAFAVKGLNAVGEAGDKAGRQLTEAMTNNKGKIPTPADTVGNREQNIRPGGVPAMPPARGTGPARELGTEAIVGSLKEPKTEKMLIHKDENVLNPKDAEKWEKLGGSLGIDKLLAGLSTIKPAPTTPGTTAKMPFDEKQLSSMFSTVKVPLDDKQINSMMGNIKMPDMSSQMNSMMGNIKMPQAPDLSKLTNSLTPSADTSARDLTSDLKTTISAIATPPKAQESAPTSPIVEDTPKIREPVDTTTVNNDMLAVLTEISKLTAQSLEYQMHTANHTEKTAGGLDGLNSNRFG